MNCSHARGQLQRLLDGDLSVRRPRVEAHLAVCPACQHELSLLQAVDEALCDETPVSPPPGLPAAVARRAALRHFARRRLLVPRWLEGLTLGAVGLAGAGIGYLAAMLAALTGAPAALSLNPAVCGGLAASAALAAFASLYYVS